MKWTRRFFILVILIILVISVLAKNNIFSGELGRFAGGTRGQGAGGTGGRGDLEPAH